MVITPGFHPGNPGSIPLVGEFLFFFFCTYFQSSAQPPDILTFNTVWVGQFRMYEFFWLKLHCFLFQFALDNQAMIGTILKYGFYN